MAHSPLVSVIIPVYNAERFIAETLQSVISQSWRNLEIIVVNDGSTDKSREIVLSIRDERIKFIEQQNCGCSSAKNAGLHIATGDYIQYLDADDILSADKIEEQVKALQENSSKIAVCRTIRFSDKPVEDTHKEIDTNFLYSNDEPFEFLLNLYGLNGKIGMIQPNAFLTPISISEEIGSWDMSLSPSPDEDGEYFCRAILASDGIIYTPGSINFYRSNSKDSLSKQHSHTYAKGALRSIELKLQHMLKKETSEGVKSVMSLHLAGFIYLYFDLYTDLVNEAQQLLKGIGYNKIPKVGGENFQRLSAIVGMKNALGIRSLARKVTFKS